MTDSSLYGDLSREAEKAGLGDYVYRLIYRLLPREVYCLTGSCATHAERTSLLNFLTVLQDKEKKAECIAKLEEAIGRELLTFSQPELGDKAEDALLKAGVWVDVPKPPEFEDVHELVMNRKDAGSGVPLSNLFPIGEWTQAYTHYRYPVRIFAFSEYLEIIKEAAKRAMKKVIGIESDDFYKKVIRLR